MNDLNTVTIPLADYDALKDSDYALTEIIRNGQVVQGYSGWGRPDRITVLYPSDEVFDIIKDMNEGAIKECKESAKEIIILEKRVAELYDELQEAKSRKWWQLLFKLG